MTKRDVLSVALRILGVSWLFDIVWSLPSTVFSFFTLDEMIKQGFKVNPTVYMLTNSFYTLLLIAIASALIVYADKIATKFAPDDSTIPLLPLLQSEKHIFSLALRVIGVSTLAIGIPKFGYILAQALHETIFADAISRYSRTEQNVQAILTLVVGLLLLFGARYLADLVYGQTSAAQNQD